jgi:hypothetical protein
MNAIADVLWGGIAVSVVLAVACAADVIRAWRKP